MFFLIILILVMYLELFYILCILINSCFICLILKVMYNYLIKYLCNGMVFYEVYF